MGFIYVKKNWTKTQAFADQAIGVLGPGSRLAPSHALDRDVQSDGVNPKSLRGTSEAAQWIGLSPFAEGARVLSLAGELRSSKPHSAAKEGKSAAEPQELPS